MTDEAQRGVRLTTVRRGALSRRGFLLGVGGAAVAGSGLLSACGTDPKNASAPNPSGSATMQATVGPNLTFSNWQSYMDVDEKNANKHPTLDRFTVQNHVAVRYIEDINDNDEFFGKIQPKLRAGQSIGRDIIVLTDWMAARMIRLGWVEQLDQS